MCVLNDLDRFHLAEDVIDRLPSSRARGLRQAGLRDRLLEHKMYIAEHGEDLPAISGWKWGEKGPPRAGPAPPKRTTSSTDILSARLARGGRGAG